MRYIPEETAEMIRHLTAEGRPVEEVAFLTRTSEDVVGKVLAGETPEVSLDAGDDPLFNGATPISVNTTE